MHILVESMEPDGADALYALHEELLGDDQWRGRVTLAERPAPDGTLGPVLEAVQIALAAQNVGALLTAVIAFLRYRTTDIELKVRRTAATTEVTLSAKRLKGLDQPALTRELAHLVDSLTPPDTDRRP
ncbi:effector-associated constant component EACC1 [Nocardia brasiliensis]|uniref:effector-associated constant component EACC1 n=1 Tax=Nocardia brasiliensis TaxID=37326 RepID=UPI001E630925|nr:hypothetical protein [Nocardia brasiliensis]